MAHYFAPQPGVRSRRREVRAHLRGSEWTFLTDRGVFAFTAIDPGSRLLVEAMTVEPSDAVLDLGCGYGPVGLAAASLAPHGSAVLVDINARAVELAQENAHRHGLSNVEVLQGDGCAPVAGRRFDVVLTNPPIRAGRQTLRRLVREAWEHLRPGGRFYFVARTAQGAKTLAKDVAAVFGDVREIERRGGYRVYAAVRQVERASETSDV